MKIEEMRGLFEEAALSCSDEEIEKIFDEIQADIEKAKELINLDLKDIDKLHSLTENTIQLREDEVVEGFDREEALSYAKEREYGYFKIKRVIE